MRYLSPVSLFIAFIVLGALGPPSAMSQEGNHRSGFWMSGGIGGGFDESMRGGPGAYLSAGTTVSSHLLLGVRAFQFEGQPFAREGSKSRSNVTVGARAYPAAERNLFFRAGLGLATDQYQELIPGTTEVRWATEANVGANLGVGRNIQLGDKNLYLTPSVDALLGFYEDGLDNPDATFLLTVGLGFR